MTRAVGRGLGKLLLCGEHAVVYGHPAIAFAVDRGTRVTLSRRAGATRIASAADDDRLRAALATAIEPEGWDVGIESDVPVGRGMGSSAALAVAAVRARAAADGERLGLDQVFDRAMALERVFHGDPSGVDVAVSSRGGMLRYTRSASGPVIEPLRSAPSWRVVVLDSGVAGNTAELVAAVRARRPAIDPLLERIGALVRDASEVLGDAPALGPLLTENHEVLRGIGVSNDTLDALVALALAHGAYGAKLAGAGGGGVVLALVDDPGPLLRAAERQGVRALECHVQPPEAP